MTGFGRWVLTAPSRRNQLITVAPTPPGWCPHKRETCGHGDGHPRRKDDRTRPSETATRRREAGAKCPPAEAGQDGQQTSGAGRGRKEPPRGPAHTSTSHFRPPGPRSAAVCPRTRGQWSCGREAQRARRGRRLTGAEVTVWRPASALTAEGTTSPTRGRVLRQAKHRAWHPEASAHGQRGQTSTGCKCAEAARQGRHMGVSCLDSGLSTDRDPWPARDTGAVA